MRKRVREIGDGGEFTVWLDSDNPSHSMSDADSVIGGGETGEAMARFGLVDRISYVSTGGGACLALLRGKQLPALEALRS